MATGSRFAAARRGALVAAVLALGAAALLAGCASRGEEQSRTVERVEVLHGHVFRLRSELKPARTTLGDVATWRLSVETPPRWSYVRVGVAPSDSSLEIGTRIQPKTPTIGPERDVWRFERTIRAFDLGPRPLPAAVALVSEGMRGDSLAFPPDTLFVDSLTAGLRAAADSDRGPLPVDLRPVDRLVAAAGVLLLLLVAAAVVC